MSEITSFLQTYPDQVQQLGESLHAQLLEQLSGIQVIIDEPARVIGYGYGPGYKQTICTIILSKKGIKLGFYKGTELPDPNKLLTGSGKVHKYVEIKSEEMIYGTELASLLKAAVEAYHHRVIS